MARPSTVKGPLAGLPRRVIRSDLRGLLGFVAKSLHQRAKGEVQVLNLLFTTTPLPDPALVKEFHRSFAGLVKTLFSL